MTTMFHPVPLAAASFLAIPGGLLPAEQDPVLTYLGSLRSAASQRTMGQALERIARIMSSGSVGADAFPWRTLRFQHVERLVAVLLAPTDPIHFAKAPDVANPDGTPFAPPTINKLVAAAKGVARQCWKLGYLTADDHARIGDVRGVPVSSEPSGREVRPDEVASLVRACGDDVTGSRNRAMLAVLFAGGLRRAELVALRLEDWTDVDGSVRVRCGKGRKERRVFLGASAAEQVRAWLRVRGDHPGALFVSTLHGTIGAKRMSTQNVYDVLRRLALAADVAPFAPHDCRRTCATAMLDAGADLFCVQRQLGHASPTTTQRYDRRGERAQRAAVELVPFPS